MLGSSPANRAGAVSLKVTVPRDLPAGQHTVTLTSDTGETATTAFTLRTVQDETRDVVKQRLQALLAKLLAWSRNR